MKLTQNNIAIGSRVKVLPGLATSGTVGKLRKIDDVIATIRVTIPARGYHDVHTLYVPIKLVEAI